jgi:hypothetical protein
MKAREELTEESDFVRGVMECDVFSVAGRVCHHTLLLGHPRNRPRPQAETVATNGAARLGAVGVIRV